MTSIEILHKEYPLATSSPTILWSLISSASGLERWLADKVTEEDGVLSFTWGEPWGEHHTLKATITERVKNSHLRLHWVDESDPEPYWEMRIERGEITGQMCLCVTDYAEPDDIDNLESLWEGNLERLHRSSGL